MSIQRIVVIGGGITGQLVQHVFPHAQVFDWGREPVHRLTREWGANYLWEPIPGLPYKQFEVITHIDGLAATTDSVRRYKAKIGKEHEVETPMQVNRLLRTQFPVRMTGYDFTEPIPGRVQYGKKADAINVDTKTVYWADGLETTYDILVSTIPLYSLLNLIIGQRVEPIWKESWFPQFEAKPIFVKVTPRPPDARYPYATVYVNYLAQGEGPYRYCDRNGERHYEGLTNMGVIPNKKLIPGKIKDLPAMPSRELRKSLWNAHLFPAGRYGAWHSDELVHQTYQTLCGLKTLTGGGR